ncbi:MAG: ATP:cob(I)alamin adenosyltransferase [Candidatus Cloacimonetes bacterium HGW-Cloacimonetes-1]|jgi:ATP:cob(I)alamin adenosyltransferase|nr:MAG: ATP:cob(I)alamin adenosyltransferase [Candidatus Cloacimonetes bacterium HGW-Cloacimonetes-1]
MSITTKTGDQGQTSLWSGERVWKDDIRVDAYGTLDELDAQIGVAKHYIKQTDILELLLDLQNKLYRVMGQLASRSKEYVVPICISDAEALTNVIREYESRLHLTGFVIPGSTIPSAHLDVCRTIARRAERRVIALSRTEELAPALLEFCNRLSDFFFMMARWVEHLDGAIVYKTKPDMIDCKGDI